MEFQRIFFFFLIKKMLLLKYCTQYISKFGKLSSIHSTRKVQFIFQSQRKTMPKNVQTAIQLYSFHILVRLCSKAFKLRFSNTWPENSQRYKLNLEKVEKPSHIANIWWIIEKARKFQKNIYFCLIDYTKAFNCFDHQKKKKNKNKKKTVGSSTRDGNTRLPYLSPETPP